MNHGLSMAAPEKMQNKSLTSLVITELRQESGSRADKTSKNANCYLTLGIRCCQISTRMSRLCLMSKDSAFQKSSKWWEGRIFPFFSHTVLCFCVLEAFSFFISKQANWVFQQIMTEDRWGIDVRSISVCMCHAPVSIILLLRLLFQPVCVIDRYCFLFCGDHYTCNWKPREIFLPSSPRRNSWQ